MRKRYKKIEPFEVRIESLAYKARGVARKNGFVWFIDGAIPGQRVIVRVRQKKKNYGEAYIEEILEPSPLQVPPPCPYFGICGGCQLQHMKYESQAEAKAGQVQDLLNHIGGLENLNVQPILFADPIYGYRNKMEFSFSNNPWVINKDITNPDKFALGLHPKRRFDKVLNLDACLLQSDQTNQLLRHIKALVIKSDLPPYDMNTHSGVWRFLVIREGKNTGDIMVNIITSSDQQEKSMKTVDTISDTLINEYGQPTTLIHSITDRIAEVAFGESERIVLGNGRITEKVGNRLYEISSNAFFQTNTLQAERLFSTIVDLSEFKGNELVYDLYCGTGAIGIYIADYVKKVIGIEVIEAAIEDGKRNIALNSLSNLQLVQADMKDILRDDSFQSTYPRPDIIILDPPRGGTHPKTIKGLVQLAAPKIVYVSCNPSILARDLQILCEEIYTLQKIQPVDMFPHTGHIEVVAVLEKKNIKAKANSKS